VILQGTRGERTDESSALCHLFSSKAPPSLPSHSYQMQHLGAATRSVLLHAFISNVFRFTVLLQQEEFFLIAPQSGAAQATAPQLQVRSDWPVIHRKSRATGTQRSRKDELPR